MRYWIAPRDGSMSRAMRFVAMIGIAVAGTAAGTSETFAKTPGARYCFAKACHRVMTLSETRAAIGRPTQAVTSFYDDCRRDPYNPCGLTSSGEVFRAGEANTAASPIYPDGTVVLVRNPANGESAVVRINNAGPYWGNRTLDLSRAAGIKLGLGRVGVARVDVTVLRAPTPSEARYVKYRRYDPVPGHVGNFETLADAHLYAVAVLDGHGTKPGRVQVAHADPTTTPLTPVTYKPISSGSRSRSGLSAEVVRVSAFDGGAIPVAQFHTRAAVAIKGATLHVAEAGRTIRVLKPRDAAAHMASPGRSRFGSKFEWLDVDGLPLLATAGEERWYRAAVAHVTGMISLSPARAADAETPLAKQASLQVALDSSNDFARRMVAACKVISPLDRCAIPGRTPGRARGTDQYSQAA